VLATLGLVLVALVCATAWWALREGDAERVVKARDLSGMSGLLYRRNSLTGGVEAVPRAGSWGGLNTVLHRAQ
jgi:2,3,4,5-tetrahydropyridine-2-carboxylate N-succinyltransferase